jgi:hypothetical protein
MSPVHVILIAAAPCLATPATAAKTRPRAPVALSVEAGPANSTLIPSHSDAMFKPEFSFVPRYALLRDEGFD